MCTSKKLGEDVTHWAQLWVWVGLQTQAACGVLSAGRSVCGHSLNGSVRKRTRSKRTTKSLNEHTCVVKALVDATAFSRPALQYTPSLVVRAMSEPTAFTTETHGRPIDSAATTARCTSFVFTCRERAGSARVRASDRRQAVTRWADGGGGGGEVDVVVEAGG